ncbi:acyl-CoA carboxylase epsilon subunit [Cellulomonas sp.]|uniref:acyl-CoA carboxylase epsilon subunit n=1 Tax=Cellulomonas sp. TaxID=40001 RepID=UPI001B151FFE|nr:acyl-CoA carboxylase epsilon subunit [Cellulomonas sp.]MBO9554665.1 acyl-CoA carboxylase subunit epsilon [Cellulomonas sp.]
MTDAHVQVVRGTPDDVELAALVAGLLAAGSDEHHHPDADAPVTSAWNDRRRTVRGGGPARPGPDAWRWSLRD